jgi:hypothetical protein
MCWSISIVAGERPVKQVKVATGSASTSPVAKEPELDVISPSPNKKRSTNQKGKWRKTW